MHQQKSSVGSVNILMSALHNENEIQMFLEKKKRLIDETIVQNEIRRDDQIANSEDFDEYA